jgi:hypothetical protein
MAWSIHEHRYGKGMDKEKRIRYIQARDQPEKTGKEDIMKFDPNLLQIVDSDYHRNGVGGTGFHVALVDDPNDGDTKLVIMFPGEGNTAVLSVNKLMEEDISFGSNSFRGDLYDEVLRPELFDEDTDEEQE